MVPICISVLVCFTSILRFSGPTIHDSRSLARGGTDKRRSMRFNVLYDKKRPNAESWKLEAENLNKKKILVVFVFCVFSKAVIDKHVKSNGHNR